MSNTPGLSTAKWVKSSYSNGGGGGCVEWAPTTAATTGLVPVRDSKIPDGPTLTFPTHGWSAFVSAVAQGRQ